MKDLILEFLFGSGELQQAFLPFIALGLSAVGAATSAIQAGQAKKQSRQAGRQLELAEQSRQEIINPYAGVTNLSGIASDLSGKISDLSGMVSNPFQNLQVATRAAEMQAAETDISLASTLDILRATGAGAGGATALAQAAARAKQGVSASIEQQEAQNARLRAEGEQQAQQMRMAEMQRVQQLQMSEAQRMQQIQLSEAQRVQQAGVAGQQFMFGAREEREIQRLNRLAGLQANYMQQQAAARSGMASALAAGAQAVASMDFIPATSSTMGGNANLLTNYSGTYIGRQ